jgi:hypothetical protein
MVKMVMEQLEVTSPASKSVDFAKLALALEDILTDIEETPGFFHSDEEDTDEPEDEEEEEYSAGTLSDKVRKYQREFGKYVDIIKRDLKDMGYQLKGSRDPQKRDEYTNKDGRKRLREPGAEKSPFDRGHKFGCGCPGCTAFRRRFFEDVTDFSIPDSRKTLTRDIESKRYTREHRDSRADYPCGGKLRGMFKHGFLRYTMGGIEKGPGMMNYLAV